MPKLIFPVGIPGCGKSKLGRYILLHNNLRVVETDGIRAELVQEGKLKNVGDQSRNQEVFEAFHARIEDHLLDGFDVYADATNLRATDRKQLKEIADRVGAETHVFVFTNLNAAIAGNRKRERRVPPDVMVTMLEKYERSAKEIPTEEYATITYIEAMI